MISLSKHTWKSIGLSSCKVKSSGVVVFSRINLSYLPRQSPLTAFDPSCLQHTPWEDKRKSMYDVAIKVKQAGAAGWGGGGVQGRGLRWREWVWVWIFYKKSATKFPPNRWNILVKWAKFWPIPGFKLWSNSTLPGPKWWTDIQGLPGRGKGGYWIRIDRHIT